MASGRNIWKREGQTPHAGLNALPQEPRHPDSPGLSLTHTATSPTRNKPNRQQPSPLSNSQPLLSGSVFGGPGGCVAFNPGTGLELAAGLAEAPSSPRPQAGPRGPAPHGPKLHVIFLIDSEEVPRFLLPVSATLTTHSHLPNARLSGLRPGGHQSPLLNWAAFLSLSAPSLPHADYPETLLSPQCMHINTYARVHTCTHVHAV